MTSSMASPAIKQPDWACISCRWQEERGSSKFRLSSPQVCSCLPPHPPSLPPAQSALIHSLLANSEQQMDHFLSSQCSILAQDLKGMHHFKPYVRTVWHEDFSFWEGCMHVPPDEGSSSAQGQCWAADLVVLSLVKNLPIQWAFLIHGLHICRFNQLQIETVYNGGALFCAATSLTSYLPHAILAGYDACPQCTPPTQCIDKCTLMGLYK